MASTSVSAGISSSGLGSQPAMRRGFPSDEDRVGGRDLVAVISYRIWENEFARDRSVLERKIRVNRSKFTVIGVAPKDFAGRKHSC
jgi:hypothetical protein